MKSVLDKQSASIGNSIDENKLLRASKENNSELADKLDEINKTLTTNLATDSAKSLNSNVIQLFKQIEKQTASLKVIEKMTQERAKTINDKASKIDQFKTISERVQGVKSNVKDFFTLKGFLNKTGIINPKSEGIVATALNRRAAKLEYIKDRQRVDPSMINLKQYGGDKKKLEKALGAQFEKGVEKRAEIRTNEAEIKRFEEKGYTEAQIKRTGLFKKREELAGEAEKIDSRLREDKPSAIDGDKKSNIDKSSADSASFSDESTLESIKLQEEQISLLEKIEENTRGLSSLPTSKPSAAVASEDGGVGIGDVLGMGGIGKKIAGSLGRGAGSLARGAASLARGAGGVLRTGAQMANAPLSGAAKFAAPLAAGLAVGEGITDLTEGKKVEDIGQVVPEGFSKLNPFSWAMRGGMYAGEKINQGYSAVSEKLGGSGSLGGDIYDGVQNIKDKSSALGSGIYDGVQNIKDKGSKAINAGAQTVSALGEKTKTALFGSKAMIMARQADRSMLEVTETIPEKLGLSELSDEKKRDKYIADLKDSEDYKKLSDEKKSEIDHMYSDKGEYSLENSKKLNADFQKTKSELETNAKEGKNAEGMIRLLEDPDTPKRNKAKYEGNPDANNTYAFSEKDRTQLLSAANSAADSSYTGLELADYTDLAKRGASKIGSVASAGLSKVGGFFDGISSSGAELLSKGKSMASQMLDSSGLTAIQKSMPMTPIYEKSAENAKLATEPQQMKTPIIVNAPTTNTSTNKQNIVMPAPVRNEDNSISSYMRRRSAFI